MDNLTRFILRDTKDFIREPYTFPGGYPKVLVMNDGECLCANCAKDNFKLILTSTIYRMDDGWRTVGITVNWEDDDLYCGHCANKLESAYGE